MRGCCRMPDDMLRANKPRAKSITRAKLIIN